MIQIELLNIKWGSDPMPDVQGRRLNMLDPDSNQIVTVVFADEPLEQLVREMSWGLTQEQRDRLSEELAEAVPEDAFKTGVQRGEEAKA